MACSSASRTGVLVDASEEAVAVLAVQRKQVGDFIVDENQQRDGHDERLPAGGASLRLRCAGPCSRERSPARNLRQNWTLGRRVTNYPPVHRTLSGRARSSGRGTLRQRLEAEAATEPSAPVPCNRRRPLVRPKASIPAVKS